VLATLRGKLEFEMGEEGREAEVIAHLTRVATVATYRERLAGVDLSGFTDHFAAGETVRTGALVSGSELLGQLGSVPGLAHVLSGLGVGEDNVTPGQVAAAVEFVLESLHLTRRLSKDSLDGATVYGS
jgi:magnesium chelatase subunit I